MRVGFYDLLFGRASNLIGEAEFYRDFTAGTRSVLEAACGSGRLFPALGAPGRLLVGFDASVELLQQAQTHYDGNTHLGQPLLCAQRMEDFAFGCRFQRIVVGYYGLSYVLDPDGRRSFLQRIADHLTPDGQAVLHLPDADLLRRPVPQAEIDAQRGSLVLKKEASGFSGRLAYQTTENRVVENGSVHITALAFSLLDESGAVLREEEAAMHYAILDRQDIVSLAASAGLRLTDCRRGFADDIESELIVTLAHV
ncbi:class I SAM-dependent methyltransferase [Oceanibaculum sp.]|uniref:class I SAM-dependent methyltransferase n=1 Tax=Oceanibaculum sp. TaxID=1903597 RepID=UPI002584AEFF|nr:class I SAM-dependent methyltransferase [Oceanibaculum sp.]MCH2396233.1 class I SAM-dependent methyltransferase [Oceanibaculum sp.]